MPDAKKPSKAETCYRCYRPTTVMRRIDWLPDQPTYRRPNTCRNDSAGRLQYLSAISIICPAFHELCWTSPLRSLNPQRKIKKIHLSIRTTVRPRGHVIHHNLLVRQLTETCMRIQQRRHQRVGCTIKHPTSRDLLRSPPRSAYDIVIVADGTRTLVSHPGQNLSFGRAHP